MAKPLARRLRRLPTAIVAGREVPVATGLRTRLLGLSHLDREETGAGLLITRCSSVHTFGMRFALDLVLLDGAGGALAIHRGVPPRRLVFHRRAAAVLELPSGTLSRQERSSSASAGDSEKKTMAARGLEIPPAAREVDVPPLPLERMRGLIDDEDWSQLEVGLSRAAELLTGREVWNVNSTAAGGGVAEMLRSWVGLARGVGVGMRWMTIDGTPEFFTLTKRLHNLLHGELGDGGELGEEERAVYERVTRASAETVLSRFGARDVIFLHDPQTAGLIPHIVGTGRAVIWRCHIGADNGNGYSAAAWEFLEPYVTRADACVFSREAYVPDYCREMVTAVVPPSIDAMSPKNQEMEPGQVRAILRHVGLLAGGEDGDGEPVFEEPDGTLQRVERKCEVVSLGQLPDADTPLVVQVSRWDRLKDPVGVLRGFAEIGPGADEAHLILAGPSLDSVVDDPDGADVLAEVEAEWRRLPEGLRSRVHLACLPMQNLDENAAIVNALQRQATVIVQKSLKEGFGLTVTEAMWKGRPVVATATGGILDQIESGVTGMLLPNPLDLKAFGAMTLEMLNSPERAQQIGLAAHERVRKAFLENRHTLQYVDLLGRVLH
jgi:trehalose synthase